MHGCYTSYACACIESSTSCLMLIHDLTLPCIQPNMHTYRQLHDVMAFAVSIFPQVLSKGLCVSAWPQRRVLKVALRPPFVCLDRDVVDLMLPPLR
jgi:hypothetical protein